MLGADPVRFWESPGAWFWEAWNPDAVETENIAVYGSGAAGNYLDEELRAGAPDYADERTVDIVGRLREAAGRFQVAYAQFAANAADAFNLGMGEEYAALENRAATAQEYLQRVADAAAGAWGWARSTFGLAGARMGVLPAIPFAYVALAAMLAWVVSITADMVRFNQKLSAVKAGALPGTVLEGDDSSTGQIATMIKWAIAGGVILIVAPHVAKALEGRGK